MVNQRPMKAVTYFRSVFFIKRKRGMVPVFLLLLAVFLLGVSGNAFAVERTWGGGSEAPGTTNNNWSRAVHWTGDIVPGAADEVIFDDDGGSTANCTIDASAVVNTTGWITSRAGYTGTITQSANEDIVCGNLDLFAGTWELENGADISCADFKIDNSATFSCASGVDESNTITATGNILHNGGTFNKGTQSTLIWNGTGGNKIWKASASSHYDDFQLTGSNQLQVTWDGGALTIDGNYEQINGTLWIDSNDIFTITGTTAISSGAIFNVGKNATLTGAVTNSSTIQLYGLNAAVTLSLGTSLTNSGTIQITDDTNTIILQGDGAQKTFSGTDIDYNTKSITLKYIDYDPDVTLGNLESLVIGDANCEFDSITINSGGTLDDSGNYNFNVSGNWSNSGTFTSGTGTVIFDTAATSTISGSTSFNNLTCTTAGKTLTFTDGTIQTIAAGGVLTLTGSSGNLITLQGSGAAGWTITDSGTENVSYVDVSYSTATNGITASSSKDSDNNTHWTFSAADITWDGSSSTDWNTAANWDLGYVPNNTDNITIPSAPGNQPVLAGATTVNNLTIDSGATLSLSGQNLTVSGTFSNTGTVELVGLTTQVVSLTPDTDSGTFTYVGDATTDWLNIKNLSAGDDYCNLIINDQHASKNRFGNSAADISIAGNCNITSASWMTNGSTNITVKGTLTLDGGDLYLNAGTVFDVTGAVVLSSAASSIAGPGTEFSVAGSWTGTAGTVNRSIVFDGTAAQAVTSGGISFATLVVTNATDYVTFNDAVTCTNFTAQTPSSKIKFKESANFTVSGTLTLDGQAAGTEIELISASDGTQWNLVSPVTTANYVKVKDSNSTNTITATNCINLGNNTHWAFGAVTRYWVAPGDSDWDTNANWASTSGGASGADYPNAGDTAVFDNGSDFNCTLDAAVSIAVLNVQVGYDGIISCGTNDFTTSANMTVTSGTFTVGANTTQVGGTLKIDGGTGTFTSGALDCNGAVSITNGTLTAPDGTGGNLNVAGNWSHSGGTFNHSDGTVIFDTAVASTIANNTTFYNLSCVTAGKQINFTAGTTQIVNNTLTLTGTSGSLVALRSTATPAKWDITFPNGTQTVSFVDVKDSDANTNTVTCYVSTDSGNNNTNWVFKNLSITTPEAGKTVGQQPTIRGTAGAGDIVTIKGTVGAVAYQAVAQVTADANGNYMVRQADYTGTLDAGGNDIRADVGATLGAPVNIIIAATPTTNQVPVISSPVDGGKVSSAKPALSGSGLAGQNVTASAWDADGNLLLTDVAATVVGADGTWSIVSSSYTSSLVKGTNYLIVTVAGVASDVVSFSFTDPYGIVFDSTTNNPIANATVTIFNSNGTLCVPGTDIAGSDFNPQTTGTDGAYSFLCANANFYITVEAPGYTYPSKKTTFPAGRVIVTGSKGEVFTVAGVIIEMDHPLDSNNLLLKIKKEANKKEAVIGEIVTYTVTIKNIGSTDVKNVFLEDRIPGGFKYLSGKAILDNISTNPKGSTALLFDIGTVNAQTTRTLKYQLIIGSGVTQGNYENRAWARYSDETVISNKDTATVKITLDPLFDLGNLIGKVFWDKNENGYQDPPQNIGGQVIVEQPVPFISIAMEDGTVVTTDKNGRYHIPAVKPGRHLLRLDESTLPEGAYLTTDKVVVVDITNGLLAKVNFGVNKSKDETPTPIRIIQKKETAKPFLNVSLYPPQVTSHQSYPDTLSGTGGHRQVTSSQLSETKEEKLKAGYEFRIFTNYPLFIERWRIEILDKDTKEIVKIFRGDASNINKPVYWAKPELNLNKEYIYILKVTGKDNKEDTTKEKKLSVLSYQPSAISQKIEETKEERLKNKWFKKEATKNSLKKQSIKVEGDTLLIKNTGAFETKVINYSDDKNLVDVIYVDGKKIDAASVAQNQKGEYELIIPEGEHKVFAAGTNAAGKQVTATKKLSVNDNYLFFIAMGDAKTGYTFHSGSIEPIKHDDKYQEGFWSEGKLAYYLKGKILGKFLITSSLDTDREQKELFRNLDPDKYYPIYGDTSKIDYRATETQGALYLLVEWDKSSFTWGNYVIDFTDTDIAGFKRTLYGAKLDYESVSKTKFGQPLTHLIAFKARAQQQAAHVEFLGTGGSLFYLKHKYIIEGSEKITVEVRDKISGLVLATMEQDEGFDYEIDYDNGRIIFWQPISHITESDIIISNYLLNGNPVYVTADYEYETEDKYDRGIYGGRVEQALGDYLSVGGTYLKEEQVENNYQLAGTDVSLRLGAKTTITAEYAESHSKELSSYISTDGGLSFTELLTAEDTRGRAYGLSASSHIIKGLGVEAYYKKVEDNFSSVSTTQEQGKELSGGKLTYNLTDNTRVALRHDTQELIDGGNAQSSLQVGANKTQTTSAQITHTLEKLKLTGEYRHQEAEGIITSYESESNANMDLLALKADYKLTEDVILSLGQQAALKGATNNQTTAGIQTKINENLTLRAKQALGTKGAATSVGAGYNLTDKLEVLGDYAIGRFGSSSTDNSFSLTTRAKGDEGDEIYHTYTVSHDELEGKKYSQVTGTKRKFKNGLEFKMEEEKSLLEGEKTNTNILGLSGDINDKAAGFIQFERGEVQNLDGTQTKRNAISLGGSYIDNEWLKASGKLELRIDKSRENAKQYLSYNALELKPNENTTLFAKANLSQSDNTTNNLRQGLYKEFSLAAAYRPVTNDKLNFFSKYTYLRNDSPASQDDYKNIEEEKAHVIAAEGAYDLSRKWQLVEKVALKMAEERVTGFDFTESRTFLSVNRLNYFIDDNWKVGAEYRFLKQKQAKDYKQGALLEVSRQIGPYAELGLGYNFTDFNDDLTHLDYTSHGPFIRVTGKFYDRSEKEKSKSKEKQLKKDMDKWAYARAEKNDILIKKLNIQLEKAKQLQKEGHLKEARLLYAQVYNQARALYIQEKEYIKEKVQFERELKEQDELAHKYCREGRLQDARKLWQNIINEIQRSKEK